LKGKIDSKNKVLQEF